MENSSTPNNHLFSTIAGGCPECGLLESQKDNNQRLEKSRKNFINESVKIFGDLYDYSKTNYINSQTKVIITCKLHGDFEVIPNKHRHSFRGCPTCSREKYEPFSEKIF